MSSSSEGVATAIAAWGHLVIMGDTEGSLNRWDTQTGRMSTVQTTQVRRHTYILAAHKTVFSSEYLFLLFEICVHVLHMPQPLKFHCGLLYSSAKGMHLARSQFKGMYTIMHPFVIHQHTSS